MKHYLIIKLVNMYLNFTKAGKTIHSFETTEVISSNAYKIQNIKQSAV